MKTNVVSYIALFNKQTVDLESVFPHKKESVFQTNKQESFESWLEGAQEKILLLDRKLVKENLETLLKKILSCESPTYTILFDITPSDFSSIQSLGLSNVEMYPEAPTEAVVKFFIEKGERQLSFQRQVSNVEHRMVDEMRNNIKTLESKVFDFFTLSQIGKSLLSMQNARDIADVLLSATLEFSGGRGAALFLLNKDKHQYEVIHAVGLNEAELKKVHFKQEEGLFWQVLNGAEPFAIRDSEGHYRFDPIVKKWHLEKLDSVMWFPLIVKNQLIGVMTLCGRPDERKYADVEVTFINQLSNQAAIAMESAILDMEKTRARESLDKKMANLSVLYDVSQALNFTNDLKKTLLLILDKAKGNVNAQKGSIMLLDKKTAMLEVSVVRGIDPMEEAKINSGEIECTRIKVGEGIAGKVAATRKPIILNKARESKEFLQSKRSNVDSIICMPLVANDEVIGVMNITNKLSGGEFVGEDIEFLSTLSGQAAITIYNAQLYNLAITDGMTKLYIRRYFEQKLEEEMHRSKRYNRPLSLIMSDVDHFKKFNDTYGHQQGDIVLIHAARLFRSNVREIDLPCRYGGEEYIVILPETDTEQAKTVADRLRTTIENYGFPGQTDPLKVTVSLGVATFPQNAETSVDLIKAVDTALYASKESGRNKVTIYTPDMKPPPE
jgi:diguanylate cyclase (GGDEF)-like protein